MKNWTVVYKERIEDYSSYVDGLSSNGGSYAFFDDTFILKSENGEYRKLVLHTTSAQFEYCALTESFSNCTQCEIINCPEISWFYVSDSIVSYDEYGCIIDGLLFVEDISVAISKDEALKIISKPMLNA